MAGAGEQAEAHRGFTVLLPGFIFIPRTGRGAQAEWTPLLVVFAVAGLILLISYPAYARARQRTREAAAAARRKVEAAEAMLDAGGSGVTPADLRGIEGLRGRGAQTMPGWPWHENTWPRAS